MNAREELVRLRHRSGFTVVEAVALAGLAIADAITDRPDPVAAFLDQLRLVEAALGSRIRVTRVGDSWSASTADGLREGRGETPTRALAALARMASAAPEEA